MSSKRAWIYCRVVHPDMIALPAQEQYLSDYAKEQGFVIAGITSEHGSGLDFSYSGIKAISSAVMAGKADILLVRNLSRLGRDMEEVEKYLHWLNEHDVELVCADGTTPALYMDMLCGLLKAYQNEHSGLKD